MSGSGWSTLAAISALMLSMAWVTAWGLGWLIADGSVTARLAQLGGGLLLTAVPASVLIYRARCHCKVAMRRLQTLAELTDRDIHGNDLIGRLPPIQPDNPWRDTTAVVERTVVGLLDELQETDIQRSALEVRCLRTTTQYERVREILAGITDPVLAVDNYDEVVLANPSAEALFDSEALSTEQRALARLVGCQKLIDLLTGTNHRKVADSRTDDVEIVDRQGQSRWYRATATKLGAAAGSAGQPSAGAVAVLRNIDDQKALQRRNAEFVSSVSHEMKTPLAGIKAYVELLADGDAEDEETREEFLEVINGQADRLQRLVDNMLNLARIEAGVVKVNKESRSLNELLEEALHVVQPSAEAKNIDLTSELSPMYLGVLADRDMLLQAAINLLSNAIKYTPQGGRVTLRSRLDDNQVCFAVEDTGVGLSEEDRLRVFEKFYRVSKDKNMASGTGLGLPLAKHIVEDVHRGSLDVSSVRGQGSTFTVTLPNAGQMS